MTGTRVLQSPLVFVWLFEYSNANCLVMCDTDCQKTVAVTVHFTKSIMRWGISLSPIGGTNSGSKVA